MTKKEKENWSGLIASHKATLEDVWGIGNHMVDYCLDKCSAYVPLENGNFIVFDKPSIETHFCFGYRLNSHDTEEYDDASDLAENARNDEDYFISENLRDFNNMIENIKNKNNEFVLIPHYYDEKLTDSLKEYVCVNSYYHVNVEGKNPIPLSDKDRNSIIKALESEKEKFTKRLHTYLKRYGLSKIRSWTYWQDA